MNVNDRFEPMTEEEALRLIDMPAGDADEERVRISWQFLYDTEAYLHLPLWYEQQIEKLLNAEVIV